MGNITPNSTIQILKNVPLNNTYKHTIYFRNKTAQTAYFNTKVEHTLSNYTYQRVQRNVCRVGITADNLYECNYMMFQNTNYGNKWFYAFITAVEFVNNEVSEITFEIDVMQTWHFDYSFNKTFVVRQHSLTDDAGDNIVPEDLPLGEYVCSNYSEIWDLYPCSIMVGFVDQDLSNYQPMYLYDNLFTDSRLIRFTRGRILELIDFVNDYQTAPEKIKYMYMCPDLILDNITDGAYVPNGSKSNDVTFTGTIADNDPTGLNPEAPFSDTLGSYTPVNKKLYTYPYNFFTLSCTSGGSMTLRYEFFTNFTVKLRLKGSLLQPVTLGIFPRGYKNASGTNYTESLMIDNFPTIGWNTDYYSAWLAQVGTTLGIKTVSSLLGTTLSLDPQGSGWKNVGKILSDVSSSAGEVLSELNKASYQAPVSHGTATPNMMIPNLDFKVMGARTHITSKMCKMIDDYFTVFGYATNEYTTPNRSSRPHWNYVQTANCCIIGSVPANDMYKINSIYDSGVTFWKDGNNIGDYSLNNAPT